LNTWQTAIVIFVAHKDKPREKALEILSRVETGAFADSLLDRARQAFNARDSAFILELVYGTLRNRTLLDWTLNQFSTQPLAKTDTWTRNILRLGAYQMLFLDKVPVSAAVNTAVDLAKDHGNKSSYVNGLLRNLDRKRASIVGPGPDDPVKKLSILHSHPEWLVRRWVKRFGEEKTEKLLRENNRPAPLIVRANTLKTTRDRLKASLEAEGAAAIETAYSTVGLEIISSPGLRSLTAYAQGWFMVQDQAAQLIGLMLGPRPGETVLDACAAPGGKATHLAELMENRGLVIALESDQGRLGRIRENSMRLGITIVSPVRGDATKYQEGRFDKVLIDAPCSGLGVLRRHPDGRWNKNEKTIRERAVLQRGILENCAKLLKPDGALVYATCTTEPEENEEVIKTFLAEHDEFAQEGPQRFLPASTARLVDDKGFFRTFPNEPAMDGFFGMRLVRKLS
jgi:16S rRNA (cytosine967-C5)-methyltransferase